MIMVEFLRICWVLERNFRRTLAVLEVGVAARCKAPRRHGKRGALGFSAQALGAAGRFEAPWGRGMRGAHELSTQVLGAVGALSQRAFLVYL